MMRAGARFILRPTREYRRQMPEEIGRPQRGITPTLPLDGANPNSFSFVSQPKAMRTTLQNLSPVRSDERIGPRPATQSPWSSIVVNEFAPLATPMNQHRPKMGARP
jgi:hypothetical protein